MRNKGVNSGQSPANSGAAYYSILSLSVNIASWNVASTKVFVVLTGNFHPASKQSEV